MFGGHQIATSHALFKLSDYTGQTIEDLFGQECYFADTDLFWALQNRAITAKQEALLKAGWTAVEILSPGQRFTQWEHVKTPKKKGGKVFITVSPDGAVQIFEGWLTQKETKKRAKAEARAEDHGGDAAKAGSPPSGPTMTKAMENYLDLHRHALARRALIGAPQVAWRLMVAHMIAPSGNWSVEPDDGQSRSAAITASVERSPSHMAFLEEEQAVHALVGWDGDDTCRGTASVFEKLLTLSDADVQRVAAYFMVLTLRAGSDVVEAVGEHLRIDPRGAWQADDCFFDLIRDRATTNAVLAEVAGEAVAKANLTEKTKTQKQIIRDCLAGTGGRAKVEAWVPGWLCFPSRQINALSVSEDAADAVRAAA